MSQIKKIVIHCSDSPDNLDIGVAEIRAWHTAKPPAGRGWSDCGYHDVVRRSGLVEIGRAENGDSVLEGKEIGAHVKGQNSDSIAVCWVGRDKPTPEQYESLIGRVRYRMALHGVPAAQVFGHYELAAGKTCPNLNMTRFRLDLLSGIYVAS